MRVALDDVVFPARLLPPNGSKGRERSILVVDESITLLPEEASATGCILVDATDQEREELNRAGFGHLTGEAGNTEA